MRQTPTRRPSALPGILLSALLLFPYALAGPAAAQDAWDLDFKYEQKSEEQVFEGMASAEELAREFKLRNEPLANAKVAQMRELTTYLLSIGVGYQTWNYQSWILDIQERIVRGTPSCQGGPEVPGPCVDMQPGFDFPTRDAEVYVFGLVKGYVNIAGGGITAQPSVTGNAFTAILHPDQGPCLASTTIGLWSPEMREQAILPLNVLVQGTHTYYVSGDDLAEVSPSARQGFRQRFDALGRVR